jgi:C-terminal processing protease CtpA/Prc
VRWIEEQPVVTRVFDDGLAKILHPGDVVTKVNGEAVDVRIERLSRVLPASTPQAMHIEVVSRLLYSRPTDSRRVTVRGADGVEREIGLQDFPPKRMTPLRSGEVYKLLSPRIGYVDLERLENDQVVPMLHRFQDTDAIVMDMRGYPRGTAWSLAPRLAEKRGLVNAQIRGNVVSAGGNGGGGVVISSEMEEQQLPPAGTPRYRGKTVLLIDERAMSAAEHSGIMYKIANGTVFIGSPTVGANGDITGFVAPGGIMIPFSGHDIRWPDGKQLQRVGLLPDIEARPTIEGIREGRDEVLERAVRYVETGK